MNKMMSDKTKIQKKIALLERQSSMVRAELEDELLKTREKVSSIGKIALGIGGGLVFAAILLGSLGSRTSKKKGQYHKSSKRVYQRFLDQLMTELSSQATDFILDVAKQKIEAIISKNGETEDDHSEFADRA
jgi:hypothetical protein